MDASRSPIPIRRPTPTPTPRSITDTAPRRSCCLAIESASGAARVQRTLGLTDLVLLGTVAIVNVNTVPPVARFGRATLALWVVAWATFFVPTAVAVLTLSRRFPGEGGVYLWTERRFGALHGFLAGWCYWTNN